MVIDVINIILVVYYIMGVGNFEYFSKGNVIYNIDFILEYYDNKIVDYWLGLLICSKYYLDILVNG